MPSDAMMCLPALQFTSMAVSKSPLRRRSGTIFSLSTENCSKILLAVLKLSWQWKASLPFLFRRWRGFSKTLISFLQTDESLGVEEKFSVFFCQACKLRSVLLTGSRSRRISSLRASKTTLFLTQTSFL